MNLSDRLFDVIDDQPVYNTVLINLPAFKKLYLMDKTDDKSRYNSQLVYIWYLCDLKSPFMNSEDRQGDSAQAALGTRSAKVSKSLEECVAEYKRRQSTPESRSMERTQQVCDNMLSELNKGKEDMKEYQRLMIDINDCMKDTNDLVTRIELMDRKLKLESDLLDKAKKASDLIPKIGKQIDTLIDLRKKVRRSALEVDSKNNKDSISNFFIDKLIDKFSR